mmetsp:Transcript_26114/g.68556  ORF Transcript_26114/g.68556 Transcript_26114/m.68556 type:complete len:100 (-) Transcript_26114:1104-1403(-)
MQATRRVDRDATVVSLSLQWRSGKAERRVDAAEAERVAQSGADAPTDHRCTGDNINPGNMIGVLRVEGGGYRVMMKRKCGEGGLNRPGRPEQMASGTLC